MKKITGPRADEHYQWIDKETGEYGTLKPEYTTMSRRPGIANSWFKKYKSDLYPKDFITVNGKKCKIPKYYDNLLEKFFPEENEIIQEQRLDLIDNHHPDKTDERLEVREKVKKLKIKQLTRNHDEKETI